MSEQKYLRRMGDGYVYGWTDALSLRDDMVPCDKDGRRLDQGLSEKEMLQETTEMEFSGNRYDVPNYLVSAVQSLIDLKTPETVIESKTEMILNGNSHMVPDSMVMDIAAVGDKMKEAVAASGSLQEKLSAVTKERMDLEKERDEIKGDRTNLRRAVTRLENKLEDVWREKRVKPDES